MGSRTEKSLYAKDGREYNEGKDKPRGDTMTGREYCEAMGLTATREEFITWMDDFKGEIAAGLAGADSSLRMIPTYLSAEALPRREGPAIVLDAGGTHLRVALIEFVPGEGPRRTYFQSVPMLGTRGRLTVEGFYDGLAALVAPIAHESERVGFCFSFPCQILPDLDGRILRFDKEVRVEGGEGSLLGEGLRRALKRLGAPHGHRVTVINDTLAAMLGAMAQGVGGPGAYVGFILGTGTNVCASFPNRRIVKDPVLAAKAGSTVVNLESGGFDKLTRSRVDLAFDAATADPGDQVLEKLISGAYQGPLALAYLRDACDAGVFTPAAEEDLRALPGLTAREISEFLLDPKAPGTLSRVGADPADRAALASILDAFFRRAARLTAATLAATLDCVGQAADPSRPVNVAAEGTAFYKCPLLHKYLLEDMETLAAGELGLYSRFVRGEDPNLTGAALAALAEREEALSCTTS